MTIRDFVDCPSRWLSGCLGLVLLAAASGCGTPSAKKEIVVYSDPLSVEYTGRQIRNFFDDLGYRTVPFYDYTSGIEMTVRRSAEQEEMHFRSRTEGSFYVITVLELNDDGMDKKGRIRATFVEVGQRDFSRKGARELERLESALLRDVRPDQVSDKVPLFGPEPFQINRP